MPSGLAMIDLLEASVSTRVHGYAARSLEDVPHVVLGIYLLDLDLEGVWIRTLALERSQYEV